LDWMVPQEVQERLGSFREYLSRKVKPHLRSWMSRSEIPKSFFEGLGREGWLGFDATSERPQERSCLERALLLEALAELSPGLAVAALAQSSLGLKGLLLFGPDELTRIHEAAAVRGETLLCLGHTEPGAGSDAGAVQMRAQRVEGGWLLEGVKAFVTNGSVADLAVVTAVSEPEATRSHRLSMFLVDLRSPGVTRTKLDKRVWVPSDLTRLTLSGAFVPEANLVGLRGGGLPQVLEIFTHSRVLIAAMTVGTAQGAFDLALEHGKHRKVFGKRILDFEAKAFEASDLYADLAAARLAMRQACWAADQGLRFRLEGSVAKYLAVKVARRMGEWAADLFGGASVNFGHPIHNYPLDAWASSLGEGTQDIQKLVIFREIIGEPGALGEST
jgi:alkylation response protein AidB-like acyl-CoA dehydrogenase